MTGVKNIEAASLLKAQRNLNLTVLACMLLGFLVFMVEVTGAQILVPWGFSLIVMLVFCKLLKWWIKSPVRIYRFALLSFFSLSMIGLLLVANYQLLYGMDFGPHGDDSKYYSYISNLANNIPTHPLTLYEHFMSHWYRLLTLVIGQLRSIDLLPLNWAFGAIVAVLAFELAYQVSGRRCPPFLVFLAIIGNCIFSNSVVNLYRDGLMLIFYLVAFVAAFKKDYLIAIVAVSLCAMIRTANAGIVLFAVVCIFLSRDRCIQRTPVLIIPLCMLLAISVLIIDRYLYLGTYLRTLASGNLQERKTTIIEQAVTRAPRYMERSDLASGDATVAAYRMGPARYVLMPVLTLFSPFKFNPLVTKIDVHIRGVGVFYVQGMSFEEVFKWITIMLWIVLGPLMVIGICRAAIGPVSQKLMLMIFLLALIGISLVSFQGRHRCAFIVFYPTFLSIAWQNHMSRQCKLCAVILGLIFILGILVRNFGLLV
jgi:hypothetical protein